VLITVQALPIDKISHLSLAQSISQVQPTDIFPCSFQLSNNELQVPQALNVTESCSAFNIDAPQKGDFDTNNLLELIIFDTVVFSQFTALLLHCQLHVQAINNINHRNSETSVRFNVICDNILESRQLLANFALTNKIEAALMYDAPKLAIEGLLVMDMDSTTIEIECIDEIAELAGVGAEVSAVTELAMQGQLDFAQSLYQRVSTLKGAPESILSDVAKDIPLMAGLKPLIKLLKQHNWRIAIASGGFTYFADHLLNLLDLDDAFANTLEIVEGKLTGKVLGDVVDAQTKADVLGILSEKYQIPHKQTVAMGDGANDLVMMGSAYLGVAFHAKPIVLAKADTTINHKGLDCLLHWLA
jgi:phosphoserine phosphatase